MKTSRENKRPLKKEEMMKLTIAKLSGNEEQEKTRIRRGKIKGTMHEILALLKMKMRRDSVPQR